MYSINFKWVRNSDILYPNVWHTFKSKAPQCSEEREYVVRDPTPEEYKSAVPLIEDFLSREPTCVATGEPITDYYQ